MYHCSSKASPAERTSTLPSAWHGFPNANPFPRLRVGGIPGTVNAWAADRTAHRGLCPAGRRMADTSKAGLARVLDMSVVLYSAVTVRNRHRIDLENAVIDSAHSTLDQVGVVCRLWCHACGEGIKFKGTYESLGSVWACRLCIDANARAGVLEHHELHGLGEVMCGRCHTARSGCEMRAPLTQHRLHRGQLADLKAHYVELSAEDAKTHALLDVRDLANAWAILGAVLGRAAWSTLPQEKKVALSKLAWIHDSDERTQEPVAGDHTLPEYSPFVQHPFYLEALNVRCPGMQSVVWCLLKASKAHCVRWVKGLLPSKSQGSLLHWQGGEICVNTSLTYLLDHPLKMADAHKVAKQATYNWKATKPARIVRCTCAYAPDGNRRVDQPGKWDDFADVRAIAPCADVRGVQ